MARSLRRNQRLRRTWRALALACGLTTAALALTGAGALAQGSSTPDDDLVLRGQDVYGRACATCHGERGLGEDQVPAIANAGAAAIDFYIRTGRMPLQDVGQPVRHGPQLLSDAEKQALIAYIPTLATDGDAGPPIPEIDAWEDADLARGLELFTSNCVACHGPTAAGIAVGQRDVSSPLDVATPLEVAEAIRVGPGVMPVFGEDVLDQEDMEAIVAWVMDLRQRESPGGAHLGRSGPVSEGFIAWIFGMGLLTAVMYLLGERAKDADDA